MAASDSSTRDTDHLWQSRLVRIGEAEYPYHYGVDCLDEIGRELSTMDADRFVVVTDDTVLALHGEALLSRLRPLGPVEVYSGPPGESLKSPSNLTECAEFCLAKGATRRTVIVAFGGGVPGNLAGLVAALLFRGIRLVHVPTTTVAAMDSTLSIKQAINSSLGKNHLGTYHPPDAVFTDVRLLATLPERELRSGLCEAAKNCLAIRPEAMSHLRAVVDEDRLSDADSMLWLLEESIAAKTEVTADDTEERRRGLVLEYGHTVGHAVELADHRRRGAEGLSHGAAIAFGMVVAAHLSRRLGWLTDADVALHEETAAALGAPTRTPEWLSISEIMTVVRDDNKRGYLPPSPGSLPLVLLRQLGVPAGAPDLPLVMVRLDEVESVLHELMSAPAALRTTPAVVR
ncbi:3-dehydroquinate synthase [Saccharopolyspora antimicrobica]|uniref:3-dehydroquinate synthase n=1 Tax=Saccharopolyspora antimicrobica TaxID=455193 RepID=A0A1I4WV54_9PSEU|nr:2-deoxy-scyllo-inosose synthase [Saccharopolyspora antimicrobica]RKT82963.1 3-dehydroquinate synthase [Saccharopolyspora antimicrobica]SFN17033.1 3-dehydroquinate synthase [Saccharopolyspora antimicrobica]